MLSFGFIRWLSSLELILPLLSMQLGLMIIFPIHVRYRPAPVAYRLGDVLSYSRFFLEALLAPNGAIRTRKMAHRSPRDFGAPFVNQALEPDLNCKGSVGLVCAQIGPPDGAGAGASAAASCFCQAK